MYMAMPSGNVVIPDKMQFPSGGGGGADVLHHPNYPRQWVPDERDGFIAWLRGEFAAANAIIDSLCHHLRLVGDDPGEYDSVIGCIQQRRHNWTTVLHMQQYFSVTEVMQSLQQVVWRRQQQQRYFDPVKVPRKEFKKIGGGYRQGYQKVSEYNSQEGNVVGNSEREERVGEKEAEANLGTEIADCDVKSVTLADDINDVGTKPEVESCSKNSGFSPPSMSGNPESEAAGVDNGCTSETKGSCDVRLENGSCSSQSLHGKQNYSTSVKSFVGTEILDGKAVNAVEGMKLYEELLDGSEVTNLIALVNDLRAAGRRGQFQGSTFVISKRPMKGHGREMIQLGLPIADAPPEDEISENSDRRTEPIPGLLQDVIERLIASQIITAKPNSCIIDIYNEGDHSQPHMWPHWFGRPVCVLFLTECDMTFGKVIGMDRPGDYKGSIRLSFTPGSMLVMQGRSTDFARHAIPALRKPRILVTLTKSQPKRSSDYPSVFAAATTQWASPPIRSPNHIRHPMVPKHYVPVPTAGVLPSPPVRGQLPPPNSVQPIYVPAGVAPAMPFPTPVALPPISAGWPAAAPLRHPPPRLLVPGTGVFLPPGSGNSSIQTPSSTTAAESLSSVAPSLSEKDNGMARPNDDCSSPNGKVDGQMLEQNCNGNVDGTKGGKLVTEEQKQVVDLKVDEAAAQTV